MATPAPPPAPAGPPMQKVSDVITALRPCRRFKSPKSDTRITSLDFDDTGELAIASRSDDTIQIFNCKEGKHAKELKSQKYGVHLARFSHNPQSIIYASTKVDHGIRFLSTHDNSYIRYFRGHSDTVTSISLCPSSDTFLSGSLDNTVRLWDLRTSHYQGLLTINSPYLTAYDPSATVMAVASPETHYILLYDVRNYDCPPFATFDLLDLEQRFLLPHGRAEWTKIEFTNDGKSLVIGTTGTGHIVLDAFSGEIRHFCYRKSGDSGRTPPAQHKPKPLHLGQGDICVSPDGQFLIGGGGDEGVMLWHIAKEPTSNHVLEPMDTLPGHGKTAIVGYNPRTNLLATADQDVYLWQPDPDLLV